MGGRVALYGTMGGVMMTALEFLVLAPNLVAPIWLELVVRVDGHKRTIVLPGALAGYKPTSASLEAGALTVGFEHA